MNHAPKPIEQNASNAATLSLVPSASASAFRLCAPAAGSGPPGSFSDEFCSRVALRMFNELAELEGWLCGAPRRFYSQSGQCVRKSVREKHEIDAHMVLTRERNRTR